MEKTRTQPPRLSGLAGGIWSEMQGYSANCSSCLSEKMRYREQEEEGEKGNFVLIFGYNTWGRLYTEGVYHILYDEARILLF